MKAISNERNYPAFLLEIKQRIRDAQYAALKAVNKELINLYWDIGKRIAEQQEKYGWGKAVVETLAKDLQKEYPGIKGFSVQNLWYMRQFYLNYKNNAKLQPLVGEISWAKNLIIIGKCKNDLEREFSPEFAGKMQFYLSLLDDKIRLENENPSIGIIICKSKNRTVVEYALKETKKPIGVATYKITSSLPKQLSRYLPSKEEIVKKLKFLEK